uniref:Uncharacterized protein n=1 Tax=Tetranychus urticae TaxID=32264 RepID=T1JYV9_TETUR
MNNKMRYLSRGMRTTPPVGLVEVLTLGIATRFGPSNQPEERDFQGFDGLTSSF